MPAQHQQQAYGVKVLMGSRLGANNIMRIADGTLTVARAAWYLRKNKYICPIL